MRHAHSFIAVFVAAAVVLAAPAAAMPTQTQQLYLSGKGPSTAVPWEFTVSGGRRAGEKASIPVPSVWEQHGFGTYNYGDDKGPHADERGTYRLTFTPPADWKGGRVRLVFEGAMTDTTVKVNGVQVGPTHQGAFTRFSYDVTRPLKLGAPNLLEVEVAKESSNRNTNLAERYADYWVFGGIFRPVWLEATPAQAIQHSAIDARADGSLTADVELAAPRTVTRVEGQVTTLAGQAVGAPFSAPIPAGGAASIRLATRIDAPRLWNAETPNLYALKLNLYQDEQVVHTTTQRFGFRTIDVRPGRGVYVNGRRVLLKGVNRHSFRPDTGRALDPEDNYQDVRLIKSLNMNAVRMSHYAPDPAFLDAADELGLYVLHELTSWQKGHDTAVGRLLVRELVERDVNHPSVLFWANGNEGGWNRELDGEFARYDPQKRRILHPWELYDDIDTYHYPSYGQLTERLAGKHVLMPTEILHALYDGGGGAGLDDYWKAISTSKVGAGAFIWNLADEGIARTDRNGKLDVYSTFGADGILGPNGERGGSYHTVRAVWSPVQIEPPVLDGGFDGSLKVKNNYDFTTLDQVRFDWQLVRFAAPQDKGSAPRMLASGSTRGPAIAPQAAGTVRLDLPKNHAGSLDRADALVVSAIGPGKQNLYTWTFPVAAPALPAPGAGARPVVAASAAGIRLTAGAVSASFDPATGLLRSFTRGQQAAGIGAGPRLVYARPSKLPPADPFGKLPKNSTGVKPFDIAWTALPAQAGTQSLERAQMANVAKLTLAFVGSDSYATYKVEISPDGSTWNTIFEGTRRGIDGERFVFPPQLVKAVRLSPAVGDRGRDIGYSTLALGYEEDRFPAAPEALGAHVSTGSSRDEAWLEARGAGGLEHLRWTLRRDGTLKLDYRYRLNGDYIYHGVSFDQRQQGLRSMKRLAAGPSRVWQNRLHGAELMVTETPYHVDRPEPTHYPEFQGYFGDLRWVRFATAGGPLQVDSGTAGLYLRVGTPLLSQANTSVEFPAGDLSFLAAIPAIGSKPISPEHSGPSSQPAKANGSYSGSLLFSLPTR